jgi:restriction endonuclease-like protein
MESYQKRLQRHLTTYKRKRLGVTQSGVFAHRGVDLIRSHVLPRELKWLNLLEPFRAELRNYLSMHRETRLHKYFHHLNSSQAFAFNLFYPYFSAEPPVRSELSTALGVDSNVEHWCFEHIPEREEETSVDVAWWASDKAPTYCEVKLSELDFGKVKPDQRHLGKLESIYRAALAEHLDVATLDPVKFFTRYQILRNVWLAAKTLNANLIFLLPRENAPLWGTIHSFFGTIAPSLRGRIHVAAVEDVLMKLASDATAPTDLRWYAQLLQEKYIISNDRVPPRRSLG